jgi:putative SOS response-associated peptidase YedK
MCGRFTMTTNTAALEERFHAHLSTEVAAPTYNAAPSQAQLTILNDHPHAIVRAAWGFVPEWADGRPDVKPLINEQHLQSSRQNSRASQQINRSFLSLGSKPFRLKLSRCC